MKRIISWLLFIGIGLVPQMAVTQESYETGNIDWDKIDRQLRLDIQNNGEQSEAVINQMLGLVYSEQQMWERAEMYFQKAVTLDSSLYVSWYKLGMLNMDTPEGIDYLKKAIAANPKFPPPYYWLGYCDCRNGQYGAAIMNLDTYLGVAKGDPAEEDRIQFAEALLGELKDGKEGENVKMIKKPKLYTQTDSLIEVGIGDSFVVSLDANPTTGYSWELGKDYPDGIVQLEDSVYSEPDASRIGAGGTDIWSFKAVGTGNTELHFKYLRLWEKDVPPAKIVTFRVNINR